MDKRSALAKLTDGMWMEVVSLRHGKQKLQVRRRVFVEGRLLEKRSLFPSQLILPYLLPRMFDLRWRFFLNNGEAGALCPPRHM